MDGIEIKGDLMTFDKRRLIGDLRGTAVVSHAEPDLTSYDRIIDCTGVARAALPAIDEDLTFQCLQYRVRFDAPPRNEIRLTSIGYAWSFPLGDREWHIGCGSLVMDPRPVIESTGWLLRTSGPGRRRLFVQESHPPHFTSSLPSLRGEERPSGGMGSGGGHRLCGTSCRRRYRTGHEERPASSRDDGMIHPVMRRQCSASSNGWRRSGGS